MDETVTRLLKCKWSFAAGLLSLLLVIAVIARGSNEKPFDPERYFQLVTKLDKFNRLYLGCPPEGFPPAIECRQAEGKFDAKLWREIDAEGRKLFK